MGKIIKNTIGNFLIVLLIFSMVTGWFFSGWPQIWHNPLIPPEIQEAQADGVTKTYTFTSDAESWSATACGASGASCSWQSGDGSPASGSIEESETRKNKGGTWTWDLSSITWESLGVPAGATVTAVDGSYNHKMATCTSCNTSGGNTSGTLLIRDSGDTATIATLETAVTYTGATTWTGRNASGAQSVGASYQTSTTGIILRISGGIQTNNTTGATAVIRQDQISFVITYTPSSGPSITASSSVQMPDYTLGGAGYTERNFSDVSAFVQVTATAGFTVTVSSTNLTGANNTISNANVKLKTDGVTANNPTIIDEISGCSTFSGVTETASGEYSLDSARTIVTTSSGSGTCNIEPTIRVYINNYNNYVEEDTGTLTFTVTSP